MLTDTRQALLDAIRDNPDDDAPRLIYADWLDENGDPERAQFIRLQCEYARLKSWMPAAVALRQQWESLEKKHGKRWRDGLPAWTDDCIFRRGFLEAASLTYEEFRRELANAWQRELLSSITINDPRIGVAAFVRDPLLQRVRGLSCSFTPNTFVDWDALCDSPFLQQLQSLFLTVSPDRAFPADLLKRLRLWRLPALRYLSLACFGAQPRLFDAFQDALLGGSLVRTVTGIDLFNVPYRHIASTVVQNASANLESLSLAHFGAPKPWLRSLAATTRFTCLRRLLLHTDLYAERSTHRPWRSFLASPMFQNLRGLGLGGGDWTDDTIAQLATAPPVAQLEHLLLMNCRRLTDTSAAAIVNSPHLRQLQSLNIVNTAITPTGNAMLRAALPACYLIDTEAYHADGHPPSLA